MDIPLIPNTVGSQTIYLNRNIQNVSVYAYINGDRMKINHNILDAAKGVLSITIPALGEGVYPYVVFSVVGGDRRRIDSGTFIIEEQVNYDEDVSGDITISGTGVSTIGDAKVNSSKIADGAVTTGKILDQNVTDAKVAAGIDAAKLANGSVSNTEFQYINGVTSNLQTQLDLKADLVNGLVPTNQLPSYVDELIEYANLAAFPATGQTDKIYYATDTAKSYRWGGSVYVEISSSLAIGELSTMAYAGDKGKEVYDGADRIAFSNSDHLLDGYTSAASYSPNVFFINKNAVANNADNFKVRVRAFIAGDVTIYAVNYNETGGMEIIDSVVQSVSVGVNVFDNTIFTTLIASYFKEDFFIAVSSGTSGLLKYKSLAGAGILYNNGVGSVAGFEISYNVTTKYGYSSSIHTMVNNNRVVYLDARVYPVTTQIAIASGTKLIGVPGKTRILVKAAIADALMLLNNVDDVLIEGITFIGDLASDYTASWAGISVHPFDEVNPTDQVDQICDKTGVGTQSGLFIYDSERVEVTNCYFKRFSKYAMHISKSGSSITYGVKIKDNYFFNNYIGLYTNLEAEYSQIANNTFATNMIGAFITTGNLLFDNNFFIRGVAGVVLYNSIAVGVAGQTDEGYNHAHGTLGNCTFNHNTLFGLIAKNIYHGELINSGQFWYAPIYLKNCRGITITNGWIYPNVYLEGSAFQYDNDNPGNNAFIGCAWGTTSPNENYNSSTSYTVLKSNYRYLGGSSTAINN